MMNVPIISAVMPSCRKKARTRGNARPTAKAAPTRQASWQANGSHSFNVTSRSMPK